MVNGLKQKAIVKPGGVVEIKSDRLQEGATVEVIVLVESPFDKSLKSLTSFIGSTKSNFATPEEVDRFIRQERDSWES